MRKHAKLAEFARNWPDLREICAKVAQCCASLRSCVCKFYANLREIYGPVCYGTVCSCLMHERQKAEGAARAALADITPAAFASGEDMRAAAG